MEAVTPDALPENHVSVGVVAVFQRRRATRQRAYSLWEAAGSPVSDGVDFWLEAERQINDEHPRVTYMRSFKEWMAEEIQD